MLSSLAIYQHQYSPRIHQDGSMMKRLTFKFTCMYLIQLRKVATRWAGGNSCALNSSCINYGGGWKGLIVCVEYNHASSYNFLEFIAEAHLFSGVGTWGPRGKNEVSHSEKVSQLRSLECICLPGASISLPCSQEVAHAPSHLAVALQPHDPIVIIISCMQNATKYNYTYTVFLTNNMKKVPEHCLTQHK